MDKNKLYRQAFEGLGFSPAAGIIYQELYECGDKSAGELHKRLKIGKTNLYKILKQLSEQGFLEQRHYVTTTTFYTAVPLEIALANYTEYLRQQIVDAILLQREQTIAKRTKSEPSDVVD